MRLGILAGGVGLFSAGIGVGGGALLVPGLIRFGPYDFRRASSLSLATIAPISFVGGITHIAFLGEGFPLAQLVSFIAAGAVGVLLGGSMLRRLPTQGLTAAFALFLVFVGLKMLTGWNFASVAIHGIDGCRALHPIASLTLFGGAVGAISALLGVGCGLIIVPFCVYVLGFGMQPAITFSLAAMFFLTSAGAIGRYRKGLLEVTAAKEMMPMALVGAVVGATISSQLPDALLRQAFGAFLLLVGAKHVVQELMQVVAPPAKEALQPDGRE